MRIRIKRLAALLFALCLCFTALFFTPVRAGADDIEISNVLASLNYTPVIYMELKYVNVSTSGTGYYITGVSWIDSKGKNETEVFGRDTYQLQISYAVYDGYHFAADARGFINNSNTNVSLTVLDGGKSALLTRSFEAEIWAPVAIKDPGNAVVEPGGWTSFVVSSMYTDVDQWYMMDPNGKIYTMQEALNKLSGMSCTGENTDKLILRDIPAGADGWSVFCRHWSVDKISYSDSKRGSITVTGAKPTPTPAPSPTPTSAPSAAPDAAGGGESGGSQGGADNTPAATPEPVFLPAWSTDTAYHWHDSEDGSLVSGRAAHSFVWRESVPATADAEGEEEGVCSVCGFTTTRVIPAAGGDAAGLGKYRPALYLLGGGVGLGIAAAAISAALAPKNRKKRR